MTLSSRKNMRDIYRLSSIEGDTRLSETETLHSQRAIHNGKVCKQTIWRSRQFPAEI